jgi:hypothetical protein
LRLFATSQEARTFAQQMAAAQWRVESGTFAEMERGAPRPPMIERNLAGQRAGSAANAAVRAR